MTDDRAHRRFLAFRDSGDPAHMARVFDLTAPKLLLLARHLVRGASDAEDLVQTTFLQAIRDAAAFDARQPLLPWLTRILANRARDLRRRRAVRAADELPPDEDLPPSRERDPLRTAIIRDDAGLVAGAIDALPEPYRAVLLLRLVHGLTPKGIAHSLGRSPGTVRVQLKRGLDLLRRTLPQSIAVPAIALLASGRGLAAVRADVLAVAAAPAGTGAACAFTTIGGTMATKKAWLLPVALLVCGAFAVPLAVPTSAPLTPEVAPATVRPLPAPSQVDSPLSDDAAQALRQAVAPFAPAPAPAAAGTRVHGVVQDVDGAAIAGANVYLAASESGQVRTDAAGRFAFEPTIPPGRWRLMASHTGFVLHGPLFVDVPSEAPPPSLEVQVVMRRTPVIRGRVLDERGTAVAGVEVRAEPPIDGTVCGGRTGVDGAFVLHAPRDGELPPVRLVVHAANGAFAPPSDERRWGAEDVVLRIERPWALRLLLVGRGSSEPVAGHAVVAPVGSERFTIEGDGHAVIGPMRRGQVRLVVVPDDRRWRPRVVDVDETTADVRVDVEPTAPIQVLARDARGEPLPDVALRLVGRRFETAADTLLGSLLQQAGGAERLGGFDGGLQHDHGVTGADGTAVLYGFGDEPLRLFAEREGFVPASVDGVVPAPGSRVEVRLSRGAMLRGRVAGAERLGAPAWVQVRTHGVASASPASGTVVGGERQAVPALLTRSTQAVRVAADGSFAVDGLAAGEADVRLGVQRYGQAPKFPGLPRHVTLREGEQVDIELDAADLGVGRIEALLIGWDDTVRLHPQHGGEVASGWVTAATPDARGVVTFDDVPAGTYALVVPLTRGMAHVRWIVASDLQVGVAGTVRPTVRLQPRRLRLRIRHDGEPFANGQCFVRFGDLAWTAGPMTTDAAGNLDLTAAPRLPVTVERRDGAMVTWRGEAAATDAEQVDVALSPVR